MSLRYPSREAQLRFAEAGERYREAFHAVQDVLGKTDLGRIPAWVFAIDRMTLEEIHRMSPELAEAEQWRRSCKVALHSLAQHMALEPEPGEEAPEGSLANPDSEEKVDEIINSLSPETHDQHDKNAVDPASQRKLDAFISVVNYARGGGCIYVNGGFEPVKRTTKPAAPPREAAPEAPMSAPPMVVDE